MLDQPVVINGRQVRPVGTVNRFATGLNRTWLQTLFFMRLLFIGFLPAQILCSFQQSPQVALSL